MAVSEHKSTPLGRLLAKARIDAELGSEFVWNAAVADVRAVCDQHKALAEALEDLMGGDDKLKVAIGGNPIYVDNFLAKTRALLAKLGA